MNTATRSLVWFLFPHMVVRTTGFPYELVRSLQAPELLALARQIEKVQAQLQALRETAPRFYSPDRKLRASFRSGRPLPENLEGDKDWLRRWNEVASKAEQLEREYHALCLREAGRLSDHLWQIITEPRFQEAVASTNPGAYHDITRLNRKVSRRLERQFIAYIQRFCTKNETVSFFGPINYGDCDLDSEQANVLLQWDGPLALRARRVHPASWVIRGLIDQIAFSPPVAPWLVLQRRTFSQLPKVQNAILQRLLEMVDGSTPLYRLCEKLGLTMDEMVSLVRDGCRARCITHQLEVPAAHEAPLENLIFRLAAFPASAIAGHMERVQAILALLSQFSAADAAGKVRIFAELRALIATHYQIEGPTSAPQFYGDRQPVREECLGTLRLHLSGPPARELQTRVGPTLDLLAGAAIRTQRAANAAVASMLGVRKLPLLQALATCADVPIPFDTELTGKITACIPDPTVSEVHLDTLALPNLSQGTSSGMVCSVDLMIKTDNVSSWAGGDAEIIVSDVHDTALVWGWALQFHAHREQVQAEMSSLLSQLGNRLPVITILASRRTGLPPAEFPGPIVELGGLSTTAHSWLHSVDDLWIESNGQEARLYSRKLKSEVLLWNGELESLFHTAFSLPRIRPLGLSLGRHTPRLVYHGVVIQREQWQLETATFAELGRVSSLAEQMRCAARIWDRYRLPERLFAKFPAERKPFYVDLASPHLLTFFGTKCQANPRVTLSEMRPGPEGLWLKSAFGSHTVELRCTYVGMERQI